MYHFLTLTRKTKVFGSCHFLCSFRAGESGKKKSNILREFRVSHSPSYVITWQMEEFIGILYVKHYKNNPKWSLGFWGQPKQCTFFQKTPKIYIFWKEWSLTTLEPLKFNFAEKHPGFSRTSKRSEQWKKPWLVGLYIGDEILPSYIGHYNKPL